MDGSPGFGQLGEILHRKLGFSQGTITENAVGAITHSLTRHQVAVPSNHTVLLLRMRIKEKWMQHTELFMLLPWLAEGGRAGTRQQLGAVWDEGFW